MREALRPVLMFDCHYPASKFSMNSACVHKVEECDAMRCQAGLNAIFVCRPAPRAVIFWMSVPASNGECCRVPVPKV